jgi:hypothetical protein
MTILLYNLQKINTRIVNKNINNKLAENLNIKNFIITLAECK